MLSGQKSWITNAGEATIRRYGGIPPYPETQNYVRAVMSKAEAYR